MTVQTSMPDGFQPQTGEEIQFEAIVLSDGTLQMTRIISRQTPATSATAPKREIMGWVNKWAGTIEMDATKTVSVDRGSSRQSCFVKLISGAACAGNGADPGDPDRLKHAQFLGWAES